MVEESSNHPTMDELKKFSVGLSSESDSERIESHLELCDQCCQTIMTLELQEDRLISQLSAALSSTSSGQTETNLNRASISMLRRIHESSRTTEPQRRDLTKPERFAGSSKIPKSIGRFEIREPLGEGSFGVVWRAFDSTLRREVAIKIPRLAGFATEELRKRFLREARAAASLEHPNILPVYESGEDGELCYIASAFCPGPDLSQWLSKYGPCTFREAAEISLDLAGALHHAHIRRVIHRDLKPANIMLDPKKSSERSQGFEFTPRITDFGLAKIADDEVDATRSRCFLGTAGYMAPEMASGCAKSVGPSADVYSLGAILYELLTQEQPFTGATEFETLQLIQTTEATVPTRVNPDIPRDLEVITLTCLQKETSRRYASAQLLQDDLRRFLNGEPISARPVGTWEQASRWCRRNPVLSTLYFTVATLLCLLAIGGSLAAISGAKQRTVIERQLWNSYVTNARLAKNSTSIGRRVDSLQSIENARRLMSSLKLGENEAILLRNQAAAALALSDLRVDRSIANAMTDERLPVAWGPQLERYAVPTSDGTIHIRRFNDDRLLLRCQCPTGNPILLNFAATGDILSGTFENAGKTFAYAWPFEGDNLIEAILLGESHSEAVPDFTNDGRSIAVADPTGRIRIHESRTGLLRREFAVPDLTNDGRSIDDPDPTGQIRLHESRKGLLSRQFIVQEAIGCRISPRDTRIAVWAGNSFSLYSFPEGRFQSHFQIGGGLRGITTISWADNGRTLAVGGSDHSVHIINLDEEQPVECMVLEGHEYRIASASFVASDRLLTSDTGGKMRLWDLNSASTVLESNGYRVRISADQRRIAGQIGSSLTRWELLDDRAHRQGTMAFFPYEAYGARAMIDRPEAVSCTSYGLDYWDLETHWNVWSIGLDLVPTEILFASSERLIARCENRLFHYEFFFPQDVQERKLVKATEIQRPSDFGHGPLKCCTSKDGRNLVVADENEFLVFEIKNDSARQILRCDVPHLAAVDICSTGLWVITSSEDGIEQWDAKTGRRMRHVSAAGTYGDLKIVPHDELIALANGDGIDLLSTRDWAVTSSLATGESPIFHIELSPNGRLLALAREKQNQIELLDLSRNRRIAALTTSRVRPWFAFSADSRLLLHQGRQFSIAFWDIESTVQHLSDLRLLD